MHTVSFSSVSNLKKYSLLTQATGEDVDVWEGKYFAHGYTANTCQSQILAQFFLALKICLFFE